MTRPLSDAVNAHMRALRTRLGERGHDEGEICEEMIASAVMAAIEIYGFDRTEGLLTGALASVRSHGRGSQGPKQ